MPAWRPASIISMRSGDMLSYIASRPLLAHGLLGLAYAGLLLLVVHPLAAFTIVVVYFYGREAGQLYHSLTEPNPFFKFLRAHALDFSLWELVQILAPAISAGALCLAVSATNG
jgi:hypothetical protein